MWNQWRVRRVSSLFGAAEIPGLLIHALQSVYLRHRSRDLDIRRWGSWPLRMSGSHWSRRDYVVKSSAALDRQAAILDIIFLFLILLDYLYGGWQRDVFQLSLDSLTSSWHWDKIITRDTIEGAVLTSTKLDLVKVRYPWCWKCIIYLFILNL